MADTGRHVAKNPVQGGHAVYYEAVVCGKEKHKGEEDEESVATVLGTLE